MSSIASTTSYIVNEQGYPIQIQLPLSVQIPPNAQSYTVTPPESTASGGGNVRGYRHEDVGRLSDMEEDGENINTVGTQGNNVKEEFNILDENKTPKVPMVNIRPNRKITLCDENSNSNISRVHPSSLAFMKEVMKDMIANLDSPRNFYELMVLQGADDGVAVHTSVITHYSKLLEDHILAHSDSKLVHVPFLSKHILKHVVSLLYHGECFIPEEDKKQVNLVWDAMQHLQIHFDYKSFFCHKVDLSIVKEEIQDPEDQTTMPGIDPAEVDQTNETWYEEDHPRVGEVPAYEYIQTVSFPHPENPSKKYIAETKYGAGKRIVRALPAMDHINGDEIQAEQIRKDREETKKLLEKNQIIVVQLSEDEDDDCPTPAKKTRVQSYPASTSIIRDEQFKQLFASGKVNYKMIKQATTAHCSKPSAATPSTSYATIDTATPSTSYATIDAATPSTSYATIDAATPSTSYATIDTAVLPNDPLCPSPAPITPEDQLGDVVVSANIPANNPKRTGITIIQPVPVPEDDPIKDEDISPPPSPTKSISEMPILQDATRPEPEVPKRRTARPRSLDITEGPIPTLPTLPTLDRMMTDDDEDNQETIGGNDFFPGEADTTSDTPIVPAPVPAAVIPKARVNNFLQNRQVPGTSTSATSQTGMGIVVRGQRTLNSRRAKPLQPPSPDVVETREEMRVAYEKEKELKSKSFIVASTKLPVPEDMRGDESILYLENMDHNPNDDEMINRLPESSRAILNRHEATSESQLVADTPAAPTRGRRGRPRNSERGTGRGRGRPSNRDNSSRNNPEVGTEHQTNEPNQPESSTQTRPVRRRGGGRRGSRGGGGEQ